MPGADVDRAVELAERRRVETAALVPAGFLPGELSLPLGVAAVSVDQAYPLGGHVAGRRAALPGEHHTQTPSGHRSVRCALRQG